MYIPELVVGMIIGAVFGASLLIIVAVMTAKNNDGKEHDRERENE